MFGGWSVQQRTEDERVHELLLYWRCGMTVRLFSYDGPTKFKHKNTYEYHSKNVNCLRLNSYMNNEKTCFVLFSFDSLFVVVNPYGVSVRFSLTFFLHASCASIFLAIHFIVYEYPVIRQLLFFAAAHTRALRIICFTRIPFWAYSIPLGAPTETVSVPSSFGAQIRRQEQQPKKLSSHSNSNNNNIQKVWEEQKQIPHIGILCMHHSHDAKMTFCISCHCGHTSYTVTDHFTRDGTKHTTHTHTHTRWMMRLVVVLCCFSFGVFIYWIYMPHESRPGAAGARWTCGFWASSHSNTQL